MEKKHKYEISVTWTGNKGSGTTDYQSYSRDHLITGKNKVELPGSSDPFFSGDETRYNPEELLISSLSACHMLWYLHLCSQAGVVVVDYTDNAVGTMEETPNGGGRFVEVMLSPQVTIADAAMMRKANELH